MRFKNFTLVISALFMTCIFFSSCKKDAFKSDEELMTNGSWRIATIISEPPYTLSDGTLVTDVQTLEAECGLDDYINFTTEGTYYQSEGPVMCVWNDEQVFQTGVWRFVTEDGQKMIEYDYNKTTGVVFKQKVKSVTSDQLVFTRITWNDRVETVTYQNID